MSSAKFKATREKLGLTQEEVAQVLGFSGKTAISNIETGVRSPSKLAMAVLEVLAELPKKDSQRFVELLRKHIAKERKASVAKTS
ncbi:MAG TPA: helix-turn-helix domain-containing protein [Bdellovibrio sp.]|nr:helix-turn-helix domain-containing protein [Bdellovibrio sp.]